MALARRQHWVIARWLLALGLGADAIDRRLRAGRLHRIHPGVYAVGRADLDRRGTWMAAVLACGEGAVLSHHSAAALWRIRGSALRPVHVTSRAARGRCLGGIALHWSRDLDEADLGLCEGIPVTSVLRTLMDLAGTLPLTQLRRAFEEADRLGLIELRSAARACERARGRRGIGALRTVVADAAYPEPAKSELERRFVEFCRAQALPWPEFDAHVEGMEVDAVWRHERVVVELDSWEHHGRTREAFERDPAKAPTLELAGYRVYRLTWRRLHREPEAVARELRAYLALGRRGGRPAA